MWAFHLTTPAELLGNSEHQRQPCAWAILDIQPYQASDDSRASHSDSNHNTDPIKKPSSQTPPEFLTHRIVNKMKWLIFFFKWLFQVTKLWDKLSPSNSSKLLSFGVSYQTVIFLKTQRWIWGACGHVLKSHDPTTVRHSHTLCVGIKVGKPSWKQFQQHPITTFKYICLLTSNAF